MVAACQVHVTFCPALIVTMFGMPIQILMPVFSEDVYEVGAGGLGVMLGAFGLGALVGSLLIAGLAQTRVPGLQLALGAAVGLST